MHAVINYLVESSIFLGIISGIYFAFLSRLNTFSFNRFFLLLSLVLTMIIPFLTVSLTMETSNTIDSQTIGYTLNEISVYPTDAQNTIVSFISGLSIFKWIYIIGLILLFIRLFVAYYRLSIIGKQNSSNQHNGIRVIQLNNPYHAFSFFKWIFINSSRYSEEEQQHVINHEKAHVSYYHTLDNMFLELFLITQWFNPFAWLIKKALKETHEFQADRSVLKHGASVGRYKALLLSEVSGHKVLAANNFNESLTKKRFNMMSKKTTLKTKIIFPLFAISSLIASALIFSCNTEKVEETLATPDEEKVEIVNVTDESIKATEVTGEVFQVVDEMPKYPGGEKALRTFIAKEVTYPKEAEENGIQGKVYITFVVAADGYVGNVEIARGVDPSLDQEAIRVIESLPQWTPGKLEGKNVNVSFTVPINFALQ
ncbi:M56 family metallopeptidase [Carboxylicivirga caseinilyticus]|uniref:M56 family metallopeptidase n=1 Tax=Carboxylicivirga caseinilyticus TaxID=3417572 RepID=UPI003D328DAC|nr:TonB family protein [Marinilabiliaceae bacterium A049]